MKKYAAQIYKASGKWYSTIEFELEIDHTITLYDQIGQGIRNENSNWNYCQPASRTLESWFVIVTIDTLPIVIWLY